jgi:hypothetical protein
MIQSDAQPAIRGHIDMVEPTGHVRGWCAATVAPFGPRRISVLLEGSRALSGITCDLFRKDLLLAGVGDGKHGFSADLPADLLVPGQADEIGLLDEDTGAAIGETTKVQWAPHMRLPDLHSHVDAIRADGLLTGWCWDAADPGRRVVLNVLTDGVHAGTAVAGLFREDLRVAGKGTGHCGFNFFLPWNLIATQARIQVTLQDSYSGLPVGQPVTLNRPLLVSTERRIGGLEQQLQMVRAELQAAGERASPAEEASGLFKVVGAFFQDLAAGRAPTSLASLKTQMDETAARLPLVRFSLTAEPAATIVLLPNGNVDALHASCAALHRAGADLQARILVLDNGDGDSADVTLIHAVVRNLQSHRIRPEETINDALRSVDTPFLVLLPAGMTVAPDWLDRLMALLAADAATALALGAIALTDQTPALRFLAADADQGLTAHVQGPADAVGTLGFVLRAQCVRDLGGLDLSYSNIAAQLLDFCLRLRINGLRIAGDAAAIATCAMQAPLLDQASGHDVQRLRATCARLTVPPPQLAPEAKHPGPRGRHKATGKTG